MGANVAESSGRWGYPDKGRFLYFARGSAYELQHWLRLAAEAELPLPPGARSRADEIARMLNGVIRALMTNDR